jgi:hypothetical protein
MPEDNPIEWLVPDPDDSAIGKILIAPNQETIEQAIAADIVTAVPLGGDALLLVRDNRADEQGIDYPTEQGLLQNTVSDLPPPWDIIAESLSLPNTVNYVNNNPDTELVPGVDLKTTYLDQVGVEIVYPDVKALPDELASPVENLTT